MRVRPTSPHPNPPPDYQGREQCATSGRLQRGLFFLILLLIVIPIWSFPIFPSSDGGAHLANADVLLRYHTAEGSAYVNYYLINSLLIPNSAGHLVLAAFLTFLPPAAAEKLLVTLIVILFPLSMGYAARALRPQAGYIAWFALPLSLSFVLHMGFYNFCLGLCAGLFTLGFWIRRRENLKFHQCLILAALGLLLYFCHLFALLVVCLGIATLAAWFTLLEGWQLCGSKNWSSLWPGVRSRCLWTGLSLSPAFALYRLFSFGDRPGIRDMKSAFLSAIAWKQLAGLGILFCYRSAEIYIAAILAVLILAIAAILILRRIASHRLLSSDGLLVFAFGLTLIFFMHHDMKSALLYIPERLILFIWMALALWIAAQESGVWPKRLIQAGAAAAALALSIVHLGVYRDFNAQLVPYVNAASLMTPHSTILPILFSPRGSPSLCDHQPDRVTVLPFFMAAGYAAATRHGVDLRNYEADKDYFPTRFRPEIDPGTHLAINLPGNKGLDRMPQRVDIVDYARNTAGRGKIDFVLLFATPHWLDGKLLANPPALADTLRIERDLADGFHLIFSSDDAKIELWKRKDLP